MENVLTAGTIRPMTDYLTFEQTDNGIATLCFNRPEALNALNMATMRAFHRTVTALAQDESLRVLIITGAGTKAFCSGGDLHELAEKPAADEGREMITVMGDALRALEQLPVPVIAAINGYALGGGTEIALGCDIRIVDEAVRFGMVQINMALTPGWGAGQRLLRVVGYSRAMHILLQGRPMKAPELLALHLANEVVPAGTALQSAMTFAEKIAETPPGVVRGIKSLLRAGLEHSYDDALMIERNLFPPLWEAEPHLAAVERFLQRQAARNRTPDNPQE